MSILKIGDLIAIRRSKAAELKNSIQKWQQDKMYSDEHKKGKIDSLKSELATTNREYTEQINQAIQEARKAALQKYHAEPKRELAEEVRLLRQTILNNEMAGELTEKYRAATLTGRDELFHHASEAVELDTPQAEAYIKVLNKLHPGQAVTKELTQRFQDNRITPDQKKAKAELDAIAEKASEFEIEVSTELYNGGGLSPGESISLKNRIYELGGRV